MMQREMSGAPSLAGWSIAAAAGIVGAAVSIVTAGFGFYQAAFLGLLVFVVVGLVLGFPQSGEPRAAVRRPVVPVPQVPVSAPMAAPDDASVLTGTVAAIGADVQRPVALTAPRSGGADDLKRIKGIGPKLELLCNSLGVYHFDQIAAWSAVEVAWMDQNLEGFRGRVTRDDWVAQARLLAAGGETAFSARVDKGEVY